MNNTVRVRFAPSPTGFFHIGSARTALFNWLYARHTGGTFVLRVEDTDKERNTEEALRVLYEGMRWLGLDWDEGPEAGGDYGPYFQSQREDIYKSYLEKLRASGRAYDKEGAVFFKISGEAQVIQDAVRGEVSRTEEKDFVIFRSNGTPVFHFVNVVDDIEMKITHVIRGEDHLSNTSKHVELFKAFGAPLPTFAHIPLILKSQGSGKMSKRDEGALIEDYASRHFLPEAVRNYLCLLGWSPKDDREILSIEEIIKLFDLSGINKNNARFDERKLSFINADYVRKLPLETLAWLTRPMLTQAGVLEEGCDEDYFQSVLAISQEKVKDLESMPDFLKYFFKEDYSQDEKAHKKIFKKPEAKTRLEEIFGLFKSQEVFTAEALEPAVEALATEHETGTGAYIQPVRFAISGQGMGPSFYPLLEVLGKDRVIGRIESFLAAS
tara:strand:- start:67482 stop:68798 length:1317 start_codon:yes stop_codon:yes gene_type:complete